MLQIIAFPSAADLILIVSATGLYDIDKSLLVFSVLLTRYAISPTFARDALGGSTALNGFRGLTPV